MFEEEAKKHKEEFIDVYLNVGGSLKAADMIGMQKEQSYQEGAEFGYNKAMEWHFVKDGIMPEENQWVLVYDGSYTVCNYHSNTPIKWLDNYENEVYEYAIIAWREIVPPKEIKENG